MQFKIKLRNGQIIWAYKMVIIDGGPDIKADNKLIDDYDIESITISNRLTELITDDYYETGTQSFHIDKDLLDLN